MKDHINYMDIDAEWEDDHGDMTKRLEERSRYSLKEAMDFDIEMVNDILNRQTLQECDRYSIATIIQNIAGEYIHYNDLTSSFITFLEEVLGEERMKNLSIGWNKRELRKFAEKVGEPGLFGSDNVFKFDPREK